MDARIMPTTWGPGSAEIGLWASAGGPRRESPAAGVEVPGGFDGTTY